MEYVLQPEYCPSKKIRDKTLEYLEKEGYSIMKIMDYDDGDSVILYSIEYKKS